MIRYLSLGLLVACGGSSGDDAPADGPGNVPAMITITGQAQTISASGGDPEPGVLIEAFANADESTAITSATTDAQGNYTLTVTTNGNVLDGFLKATKTGLLVTYLYPPEPLAENFDGASINMISRSTVDTLTASFLCDETQPETTGMIAALVYDASDMPLAGAMLSASPSPSSICYNANGFPSGNATATSDDGIGYMFNVTGNATVSATATGVTLRSHQVKARAGALTTTLIRP